MFSMCLSDEWDVPCEVVVFWEFALVWVVWRSFRFWRVLLLSRVVYLGGVFLLDSVSFRVLGP